MAGTGKDRKGRDATSQDVDHYDRYPEEAVIDEMEAEEADPESAGTELAEEFGAVSGKPSGRKD